MRIWLLPLCAALILPVFAADDAVSRQRELARVKERIQAVQARVKSDRGRQDELQNQLEDIETQISLTQQRLRSLREQVGVQQRKVEDTRTLQLRAEGTLQLQRTTLARQLRAAHGIGQSGQLKLVLNQEDVQKVGRVLAYYDYLNRARSSRIKGIRSQLDMMRGIGQQLGTELGTLNTLRTQQEEALAVLAKTRAERALTIQRLAGRIADALEELKTLEADEHRIQGLLEQLREALADVPMDAGEEQPLIQRRGKLPWPLRGKLLAEYGQAKAGGKFNWRGLWIEAPEGTPVRAVARGRIAYAGWMQRYGLIVILEHAGGYYSLYGHLQRVPRAEGEWINAGEALALAGNTGGYDKSGVYLEMRKGREPMNPAEWLAK